MQPQGLIIIHTGDGKGKTTAAMGMALRAAGHQFRCLMIQFIKGSWAYGELEAVKKLHPYFEIIPMGKGFIRFDQGGPTPEDLQAVQETWNFFLEQMQCGRYDLIILDEINYVIDYQLLPVEEVVEALKNKPASLHVILTGRNAKPEIMDLADLVTEMKEIKHPYKKSIRAQKGIEF
jgi:cob(I)alamin adenosyltransferase